MGGAVPIIGLGLQAVGSLGGGGTQYSPDPRAKYEADLLALSQAEQNAQKQEALLIQQRDVANYLNDYQATQQFYQTQKERDFYKSSLENEYQQGLYQNNLNQAQLDSQILGQDWANTLQEQGADAQYQQGLRALDIQNLQNQAGYQFGQNARGLQRQDSLMSEKFANQGLDLQGKGLDLEQLNNNAARQQILGQRAGVDLQERGTYADYVNQQIGVDNQRLASDMAMRQEIIGAQQNRQADWNQLMSTFLGNRQDAQQMRAKFGAAGLGQNAQTLGLEANLNNDPRVFAQQQQSRGQFSNRIGNATIQNDLNQGQLNNQAEFNKIGLANAMDNYALQRAMLSQNEAGISRSDANIGLQRQGLDLERGQNRYKTNSFMNQLAQQEQEDYFSRRLLPEITDQYQRDTLQMQNALQRGEIDLNKYLQNFQNKLNQDQLDLEKKGLGINKSTGSSILDADYARQIASGDAAKKSTALNNDQQLAAALAQLASGQYGLLSQIGSGLSSPYPSGGGGGFDLGAIGGILSQAAQMGLFSGGGSNRNYSWNSGYSTSFPGYGQRQNWYNPSSVSYDNIGIYNNNTRSSGGSGGF